MFHKNALVLGLSLLLVLSAPAKSFTKPGAGVSVRGGAASGATKSSLNSDSSSSSRRTAEALPEAGLTNKKKEEVATPARTARSLVQKRRSVIPFRSKSYIKSTQLDTKKLDKDIPSVRKVLLFAIPCIGVWMYMPLLSMMDTSAVGKFAGTAQQAALNPAIAIINYGTRLLVSIDCRCSPCDAIRESHIEP